MKGLICAGGTGPEKSVTKSSPASPSLPWRLGVELIKLSNACASWVSVMPELFVTPRLTDAALVLVTTT